MQEMPVVKVETIRLLKKGEGRSEKVKALADVSLGGQYVVKGFRVIKGSKGMFVSMPSTLRRGVHWKTFVPITKEGRSQLHKAVMSAYEEAAKVHEMMFGNGGK